MDDMICMFYEYEQICQLKYWYFCVVDMYDWMLFVVCLIEDCEVWLYGGWYVYDGCDVFVLSLCELIGKLIFLMMYYGYYLEFMLVLVEYVCGIWFFEDYVINFDDDYLLYGIVFYDDQYVKCDGVWCIYVMCYEWLFEIVMLLILLLFMLIVNCFVFGVY